jgi:hypothetical protein
MVMSILTNGGAHRGAMTRSRIGIAVAALVAMSMIAFGGVAIASSPDTQAVATTPVTVTCTGGTYISPNPVFTLFGCHGSSTTAKVTSAALVRIRGTGFVTYWTNGKSTDWYAQSGVQTPPGTCPTILGIASKGVLTQQIVVTGGSSMLTTGVTGTLKECHYPSSNDLSEALIISSFTV